METRVIGGRVRRGIGKMKRNMMVVVQMKSGTETIRGIEEEGKIKIEESEGQRVMMLELMIMIMTVVVIELVTMIAAEGTKSVKIIH